ncbi:MAG: hypothetical protein H7330_04560 [Hymenobacteraceae bacterium]|nr:hypothetical protein [Hymenobacteraceae bacterium]
MNTSSAPPSEIAEAGLSDTMHLSNGVVVKLEAIKQSEFGAAPESIDSPLITPDDSPTADWESISRSKILQDSARVRLRDSTLLLKPSRAAPVRLMSGIPAGSDETSVERYTFLGTLHPLPYWLVAIGGYCGGHYLLVSQETGIQTHLLEWPIVSPDARLLACGKSVASVGDGGLEVWEIRRDYSLRVLYGGSGYTQHASGVSALRWADNHTLLLTQTVEEPTNEKDENGISVKYVKLRLPM